MSMRPLDFWDTVPLSPPKDDKCHSSNQMCACPSVVSHAKVYNCSGRAMLCGMWARNTALAVTAEDTAELERIVRSGRTEQRHALRARIILGAAEGRSNNALAKELKTSRPTVVDWRARYVEGGVKA